MKACRQSCCVGAFIWLVSASLAGLLCIQVFIIIIFGLGIPIPFPPERLETWINQRIDHRYSVSLARIRINRNALIQIEGITLRERLRDLPVLEIESAGIDFFAPGLITGQIRPESISVTGLVLFEKVERLDNPSSILDIPSLRLRSSRNAWQIENAFARISDISLTGFGIVDFDSLQRLFPQDQAGQVTPYAIPDLHRDVTEAISTLEKLTAGFVGTSIFFELGQGSFQSKEIRWRLAIPSASPLPGVAAENFQINGQTTIGEGSIESTLSGRIGQIHTDQVSVVEADWHLGVKYSVGIPDPFQISRIEIAGDRIEIAGETIRSLIVDMNDPMSGDVLAEGSFFYRETPIQFRTDIDTNSLSGIIDLETRIDPIKAIGAFPDLARQLKEAIKIPTPINLQATAFLRPGGIPDSLGFFLETGRIDVLGMDGERLSASGHIFPEGLRIRRFNFDTRQYNLEGNFSADFANSDWRVSFTGGAIPRELSGWFEPWWDNLWARFEFSQPPFVDFRIRGNATSRQDRDIYGEIRLPPTAISDFPIDRATALVWGDERYLTVLISDATAPAGDLSGSLHYFYNYRRNLLVARAYDFVTNIRLPDDFKVMGEGIRQLLDRFETTGPADLAIRGVVVAPEADESLRRHETLHIRGRTDLPVSTASITFDDLRFRATYANHVATVTSLNFGIGGGRGEGSLTWQQQPDPHIDLEFRITDADPRATLQSISLLRDSDTLDSGKPDSPDRRNRRLDLFAKLAGDPNFPTGFVGEAVASIHSPDLGEVRVLGILSRLFAAAPPPFNIGSIRFNQLETAFTLGGEKVDFTRFDLYSSSSRIKATGSYSLKTGMVDMRLRVYLFQEISMPVIGWAAQIFKPLARILVFDLGGTVTADATDLRLNPGDDSNDPGRSRR